MEWGRLKENRKNYGLRELNIDKRSIGSRNQNSTFESREFVF